MKKIKLDLVLFIVLMILFVLLIRSDISRLGDLEKRSGSIDEEIRSETARQSVLKKYIGRLGNAEGIEMIARRKLGLVRPGENAYRIIDKD